MSKHFINDGAALPLKYNLVYHCQVLAENQKNTFYSFASLLVLFTTLVAHLTTSIDAMPLEYYDLTIIIIYAIHGSIIVSILLQFNHNNWSSNSSLIWPPYYPVIIGFNLLQTFTSYTLQYEELQLKMTLSYAFYIALLFSYTCIHLTWSKYSTPIINTALVMHLHWYIINYILVICDYWSINCKERGIGLSSVVSCVVMYWRLCPHKLKHDRLFMIFMVIESTILHKTNKVNSKFMAVDYSLVITWTYFIVYAVTFLIASIICAQLVRKRYNASKSKPGQKIMSRKSAFIHWCFLLWKKKRVYIQLIPHFFDQATDFGVIYEYWNIYQSGGVDGINTLYLFGVSIAILILHRIISSIAIYRLTKNWKYSILQIFDLLMIQCIYTNYVLDTDEPSNAQRYLQVLEATFESAPQILISTAFLVKAKNTDISAVVYISLLTSFWTLAARVASDDKAMMKMDWRSIDFRLRKTPCINGRYIVRVLLWRFLEISSRVAILTIVWINLGGLTIFILVGLELVYLTILSYVMGTIDIMGNIVYLRAANSNQTDKMWGQTMTYYFWIYRVVSAYILLILSTIFATTQFDAKHIQDYNARNHQTLKESVGLVVFIYCWIATPLWQWIGAIIVFDHGNLQSISRDIDQLVEQEKWLDVWELIKFGVIDFKPEPALKKIYYAQNVNEMLLDVLGSIFYDSCINRGMINWQRMLLEACKANNFKLVKLIGDHKEETQIDINKPDKSGRTPIFYCDKMDIIEYLVKIHEANCQIRDDEGNTVVHYYLKSKFNCIKKYSEYPTILSIIKCIVEGSNLNPNTRDQDGNNLFTVAVNTQQNDRIQAYLSQQCKEQLHAIKQETIASPEGEKDMISKAQTYTVKDSKQSINQIEWNKYTSTDKQPSALDKLPITRCGVKCLWSLPIIMMLIGIDVILLTLQQQYKCKSVNDELMPLNDWMIIGTSLSIILTCTIFMTCLIIMCCNWLKNCDVCNENGYHATTAGSVLLLLIFYSSWAGVGITVYQNIDDSTKYGRQCSDVVLGWIILKFCASMCLCGLVSLILLDYAGPCYYVYRGCCGGDYYYLGCWTCWDCNCCGVINDDDYVNEEKEIELEIDKDEMKNLSVFKSNRLMRNNEVKEEDIPNCHKCNEKMLVTEISKFDTRRCYGCTKQMKDFFVEEKVEEKLPKAEIWWPEVNGTKETLKKPDKHEERVQKKPKHQQLAWICQDFAKETIHEKDYILCRECGIKKNNDLEFVDIEQKRQEQALRFLMEKDIQKQDVPKCKYGEDMYLFKAKEARWDWDTTSVWCSACGAWNKDDELVWHCGHMHDYDLCQDCGVKQLKGTLKLLILKRERERILWKDTICKCNEIMYEAYNPGLKYTIGLKACNGKYLRVNGYARNQYANDWFIPDGKWCDSRSQQTFRVDPSKYGGNRVTFVHQYSSTYGYLACKQNRAWLNDSPTNAAVDHEMIRCDDKWAIKSSYGTYLSIRKLNSNDDVPNVWWSDRLGEAEKFTIHVIDAHGPVTNDKAEEEDAWREYQLSCSECKEEFYFDALMHCQRKKSEHQNHYRLCPDCKEKRNIEIYSSELMESRHKISAELLKIQGIEQMDIPDCKCNEQMIMIEAAEAKYLGHDKAHINCNQCGNKFEGDAIIWYCDGGKHPQGYALCLDCGSALKETGNETANDTTNANVNKDLYID